MPEPTSIQVQDFPGWFCPSTDPASSNPSILFIHGAFGHHRNFRNFMSYFASAGFDCYALSRRGRLGLGPERARGLNFQDYVDDTARMIQALPGHPPIVIGHGLGGLLAQKAAEQGLCSLAVLLSSAPPGRLTAQPQTLPAFMPMMPGIALGFPIQPTPQAMKQVAFNRLPAAEQERLVQDLVHESGIVYRQLMAGQIHIDSERIQCPILCVAGKHDHIVSAGHNRLTSRVCKAELREFDRHGHWLLDEPGWQDTASEINDWVRTRVSHLQLSTPAKIQSRASLQPLA
ncbi:MAG: alpha/beta hydrolase [Candidatus Sericytochromatia bacterium]